VRDGAQERGRDRRSRRQGEEEGGRAGKDKSVGHREAEKR
jgi:hypothetical protein